jgi:hypothetical protein
MLIGVAASAALSGLMVALPSTDPLGVGPFWSWFLTGLQVLSLAAIARGKPAAWLLGAAVQTSWVTYALLTAQQGFIPGCLLSLVVQVNSYLRTSRAARADRAMALGHGRPPGLATAGALGVATPGVAKPGVAKPEVSNSTKRAQDAVVAVIAPPSITDRKRSNGGSLAPITPPAARPLRDGRCAVPAGASHAGRGAAGRPAAARDRGP